MKAYGVPRNDDIETPDIGDIRLYGFSSKYGVRVYEKSRARRVWKRRARAAARREIRDNCDD
jgi:hypothetical protein